MLHPRFTVEADLERRAVLPVPRECPSSAEGGRVCRGTSFQIVPEESVHTDYQEVGNTTTPSQVANSAACVSCAQHHAGLLCIFQL